MSSESDENVDISLTVSPQKKYGKAIKDIFGIDPSNLKIMSDSSVNKIPYNIIIVDASGQSLDLTKYIDKQISSGKVNIKSSSLDIKHEGEESFSSKTAFEKYIENLKINSANQIKLQELSKVFKDALILYKDELTIYNQLILDGVEGSKKNLAYQRLLKKWKSVNDILKQVVHNDENIQLITLGTLKVNQISSLPTQLFMHTLAANILDNQVKYENDKNLINICKIITENELTWKCDTVNEIIGMPSAYFNPRMSSLKKANQDNIAQPFANCIFNAEDTPERQMEKIEALDKIFKDPKTLKIPKTLVFEDDQGFSFNKKAKNKIIENLAHNSKTSLLQIVKILSGIKKLGFNLGASGHSLIQNKLNTFNQDLTEIMDKLSSIDKTLSEVSGTTEREKLIKERDLLITKYQIMKTEYEEIQNIKAPGKQDVSFIEDFTRPSIKKSMTMFQKDLGSRALNSIKSIFSQSLPNLPIPKAPSPPTNSAVDLKHKEAEIQAPAPVLTQHHLNRDKALSVNQTLITTSSTVQFKDYRAAIIAAETNLIAQQKRGDPKYQGVKLVQGFTKPGNTKSIDKVIIESENADPKLPPHKMISKFIPATAQNNTLLNQQVKGHVEVRIDPNPDDKILYHALALHKSLRNLKLAPSSNVKSILNLINVAASIGWKVEVMVAGKEAEWQAKVSSTGNRLGITQTDYEKILKFMRTPDIEKRLNPEQIKRYQDLIDQNIRQSNIEERLHKPSLGA